MINRVPNNRCPILIIVCTTCVIFAGLSIVFSQKSITNSFKYITFPSISSTMRDSLLLCMQNLKNISDILNSTLFEKHRMRDHPLQYKSFNITKDRSLFELHPFGKRNKTIVPDICVALLSCKRIHFLRRTVRAIIYYFAKIEPSVTYEIALLDNGSDRETVNEILNDYPIDILILRQENVGIAEGLDTLFHGACRSPFILSLEDDWEARFVTWPLNIPVMAMSMHVLNSDPLVLEIWLRDWQNGLQDHRNRTEWLQAPVHPNLMNGEKIMYRRLSRTPNTVWGGYTNGASLKHRDRLYSIGYMKVHSNRTILDFNGEYRYAERVLNAGYTSAHLCLPTWHPELKCNLVPKDKEPYIMPGLFQHLGGGARSAGHQDFNGIETVPG